MSASAVAPTSARFAIAFFVTTSASSGGFAAML